MTLCGEGYTPCCDLCIYSIRDIWVDENGWGKVTKARKDIVLE